MVLAFSDETWINIISPLTMVFALLAFLVIAGVLAVVIAEAFRGGRS
jgi:hypothetical protein